MKTATGYKCDACERIEEKNTLTQDSRPFMSSRDRFFDFKIAPKKEDVSPLSGRVKPGKFRGVASDSNDKTLAVLHACPGCAPKIKNAFANNDMSLLPQGPLRGIMTQVAAKYGTKSVLRLN